MKNPHLQRLDRQLRLRGEWVQLVRTTGTAPQINTRANVRGVVKTLGAAQLMAGLTQANYVVIVSPTHLRRAGWPGGDAATIPPGTRPLKDGVIPVTTDKLFIRSAPKAISRVDAIYDGDEVVRIELYCTG